MYPNNFLVESIIPLTVTDEKDKSWPGQFGTAFAIKSDEESIYFLTCAHVVKRDGRRDSEIIVKSGNANLKVIIPGESNGIDLAILQANRQDLQDKEDKEKEKEEKEKQPQPLKLCISGARDRSIQIQGFSKYAQILTQMLKIDGKLDDVSMIFSEDSKSKVNAWHIRTNENKYIQPGYSGAPVIDSETGYVLGIVSHKEEKGRKGLAISIEAIQIIWEESPPIINYPETNSMQEIRGINNDWLLTYIAEDQLQKLTSSLLNDLTNLNERKIQSAFSYWGAAPTTMWIQACDAINYVMYHSINEFMTCAKPILETYLNHKKRSYDFVSLGVGNGKKDEDIILEFFRDKDFVYIPVDTSLDMLRVATKKGVIKQLPVQRRIAIQRDITDNDGLQQIAMIARKSGGQRPILFGFLGNTLANLEEPEQILKNIIEVMNDDDLLLCEVQIVNSDVFERDNLMQQSIQIAKNQYEDSRFRRFAESALIQYCDISVSPNERNQYYRVEVSALKETWTSGKILKIDCFFKNISNSPLDIIFFNERQHQLQPNDAIRLYRSRKFPEDVLRKLFESIGFQVIASNNKISDKTIGFGFTVFILKKGKRNGKD